MTLPTTPPINLPTMTEVALHQVRPDTLDETLPGVHVLAEQLRALLREHVDMGRAHTAAPDARERSIIERDLVRHIVRIQATWQAAHLVTGAEDQARRSVDGVLRPYVVDADREQRLAWLNHAEGDDLDVPNAYSRAAGRMRSLVGDLAARGYATEERALP